MAVKIYHVHPLVAGPLTTWPALFERIRAMGFDHVCLAPPFAPDAGGDIYVTADHEALHPALGWEGPADAGIAHIARLAGHHGLRLMLDLVLYQVAADAVLRRRSPDWFSTGFCGGPPDPRRAPARPDAAAPRFGATDSAEGLVAWWSDRMACLIHAGAAGFRAVEPDRVPPGIWRRLIERLRATGADALMLAWTPATDRAAATRLAGVGFDLVAGSVAWWDGRSSWLTEELGALRPVAPAIGSPEPSFFERLAARLPFGTDIAGAYRHALRVTAAVASGMLVPMGFEYATRRPFDAARATPEDLRHAQAEAPCDLGVDIAQANELLDRVAALRLGGALRQLTASSARATALLRCDAPDPRAAGRAAVVLINPDLASAAPLPIDLATLPPVAGAAFGAPEPLDHSIDPVIPLEPGEVRVLAYQPVRPILHAAEVPALDHDAAVHTRIAIEAITPSVADGDYAAKRVVGETVTVTADIVADGHEVLAASLLWRAADETSWRRHPMTLVNNDRWQAVFTPARVGPHVFTVEAWWDVWGTFRHDLDAKHAAGVPVTLEIEEGRRMLDAAARRAEGPKRDKLALLLGQFNAADDPARIDLLLSDPARAAMQSVDPQEFLVRHRPPLRLDVDRPQAAFASWYELFPRSETQDPSRHGSFDDVIARLPAIRAMGFDVLYFPPIHPIGHTNRKGRNNALRAEPSDVGSPYAIGSEEGGHDAIHPQLGTLVDFHRLVAAAKAHELEVALDFAIQCSPDHPWLKQHPDWFRWRPDGSLRYAENPPKKYEDIVNPDFFAPAAFPALWHALRDVVQFWADQGVRIFRVDNPHTKPMPFWRWMIADIRDRHPDVIFLAEAFTRPKVMYRLAKLGFTQSYTYFTWRSTKQELTDYLTELSTLPVADFFRPNFFVNTPDINPPFLQTGGRPAFLIRAALAAMLSGLWGMYSGFEICESAPLPGREEYLDAEKYQIRVRDYTAPGNIVAEITALNRIRREHPALQTHRDVTFHPAFNDQVLLFSKRVPEDREMILVAVNLDPHHAQEADVEVPLWELRQPDNGALDVVDLMRGHRFTWYGKRQHIRLDPADLPFAIWQVTAPGVPK
ncbi:MAG TPA: alpha-1,4-glucan--maltose-1-phosphate maltosyltransferase [Acetobacteraceae bacterium]|nr:alpha-1,4-glucan--maltose-1-phosphate maltosyltransferase [Acetobacteraceae bacterium]